MSQFKNPYNKPSINHINENPDAVLKLQNFAFSCNKQDHEPFMTINIIDSCKTHIKNSDKVVGFIGIDSKTIDFKGEGSLSRAFDRLGYKIVPKRRPVVEVVENYLKSFWS